MIILDDARVDSSIERVAKSKFAKLEIHPRLDAKSDTSYWIPPNFDAAVMELECLLPEEYFLYLIERFGRRETGDKVNRFAGSIDFDEHFHDLSLYLVKIWGLRDHRVRGIGKFRRQMTCMHKSNFQILGSLFYAAAYKKEKGFRYGPSNASEYMYTVLRNVCLEDRTN